MLYNGTKIWSAQTSLKPLLAPVSPLLHRYLPQFEYLFLDEQRASTTKELGKRNLVAAVFALEQSTELSARQRVLSALRRWMHTRPDLLAAFGTWYTEVVDSKHLPGGKRPGTISLDKADPMIAMHIRNEIRRESAKAEARGLVKGEAKGAITVIRDMVQARIISLDEARTQARALVRRGIISRAQAQRALSALG